LLVGTLSSILFVSWNIKLEQLQQRQRNIVGDVFIAAAAVAYLGPFSQSYRYQKIKLSAIEIFF
jgi:hypothetical protein